VEVDELDGGEGVGRVGGPCDLVRGELEEAKGEVTRAARRERRVAASSRSAKEEKGLGQGCPARA
jgi:hypothetical protein